MVVAASTPSLLKPPTAPPGLSPLPPPAIQTHQSGARSARRALSLSRCGAGLSVHCPPPHLTAPPPAARDEQCPGAAVFVIKTKTGVGLLHTGDFRATAAMAKHPAITAIGIDTIYLDTTYCHPKHELPVRHHVLSASRTRVDLWRSSPLQSATAA